MLPWPGFTTSTSGDSLATLTRFEVPFVGAGTQKCADSRQFPQIHRAIDADHAVDFIDPVE